MWSFERISASERSGILSVLVAVPFFSLTGLFGKFIPLSPLLIVQWRTIFAFVTLLLVLLIFRKKKSSFFVFYKDFENSMDFHRFLSVFGHFGDVMAIVE